MITVLRLSHRAGRDKRMTTHCALAARALGAGEIVYTGDHDGNMEENVESVSKRWGGEFEIKHKERWKTFLKNFDGKRVYLSMYGAPVQDCMDEVRGSEEDICVVVGGEKVPGDIYDYMDIQVGVTNQPHSEVAALAVFLDRLQEGEELDQDFDGASVEVVPKEKGKEIQEK